MVIKLTEHVKQRTVERIKKVKNEQEATEYLKDKFRRLMEGKFENTKKKWTKGGRNIIQSSLHKIIYKRVENQYTLITYYLNSNYKN